MLLTITSAEKISALITEACLGQRAQQGDRQRIQQALAKGADVELADETRCSRAELFRDFRRGASATGPRTACYGSVTPRNDPDTRLL